MNGSFTIRIEATFESAHFLRSYRGVAEPLHGHSYKVEAELISTAAGLDQDSIAVDFVSSNSKLESLAKKLDYGCINQVPPFDTISPSAENIARWFCEELGRLLAPDRAAVRSVTIWEGPRNAATYYPDEYPDE